MNELEKSLTAFFDRKHCILTARGTTAIYLALKEIERPDGEVLLPALLCPSPVYAILYAGMKPITCDINLHDFNINIDSFRENITCRTVALIVPHIFGHVVDLAPILDIAREYNLLTIEDCAHALKIKRADKRPDITVISFSKRKIIDAGWCGALLTDNDDIACKIREENNKLEPMSAHQNELYAFHENYYYNTLRLSEVDVSESLRLQSFIPQIFKRHYVSRPGSISSEFIIQELLSLEGNLQKRIANAAVYQGRFIHPQITHPKPVEGSIYFRYSILIRDAEQKKLLTNHLREKGFRVSNLYPSLHPWSAVKTKCPNAEYVSARIINLLVEPGIERDSAKNCCDEIMRFLG